MPTDTAPLLERIANGRTDLVFDYLAAGNPANAADANGVSLMQHCAYYGDVSAIRHLLANGASLGVLGDDLGLNGACFTATGGWHSSCWSRVPTPPAPIPRLARRRSTPHSAPPSASQAGAKLDAKDAHGDSPLGWASWHMRPDAILRMLCYGPYRVNPQRSSMREYLQGEPR